MERKYFAATIAMAVTFAAFSHAFSSGLMAKLEAKQTTLVSEMHCAAQSLRSELLDKVNRSLGSRTAEDAQLRIELNLPAPTVAIPPVPPVAPVAPVAPVPASAAVKAQAPRPMACPAQRLSSDVRLSEEINNRMQVRMLALQSKLLSNQARMQAKLMAQQARLTSQALQRQAHQVALAQVRAYLAQARVNTQHPCRGSSDERVARENAYEDTDWDQLGRDISEEVSRSIENSVRNF